MARFTAFVARYQMPLALLCVLGIALDFVPGIRAPPGVLLALGSLAASLGVARPSEAARSLAATVEARDGLKIAALIAALAGAFLGVDASQSEHSDPIAVDVVAETEVAP